MSIFSATTFYNIQAAAAAPVGPSFAFRTDAFSASLVVACPYSNFTTLGMTNFYDNCAGAIKTGTFSDGYKLVPTGSNVGTAGPQLYASSSQFVNSGSFNFSTSGGYSTALMISGSQNAGTITTASANLGSNSFVMECWINLKGGTFGEPPFNMFLFGEASGDYVLYDYANGASAFRGYMNGGTGWETLTPSWAAKTNNVWYHLAYVKSGTNLYVYWNGNRIGNGIRPATVTNPPSAYWRILGVSDGNNSNGYGKLVQDFRFYVGTDKGWTGATITPSDSIVVVS